MNRLRLRSIQLILGCFFIGCIVVPADVAFCGIPTNDPEANTNRIAKEIKEFNQNTVGKLNAYKKGMLDEVNRYKDMANEAISSFAADIQSTIDNVTKEIDSAVEEAGNTVLSYAGEQWDSLTGSTPGSGFTESETFKSIKGAIKEYGAYVAPVVKAASGNILGALGDVRDALYTKAGGTDELSGYDVVQIQNNLKKYLEDATRVAISDATQIMNGTSQYQKVNDTAKKSGSKNLGEDISTSNDAGLTMNVMTNVLLSMDITELSIQSAMIYDSINQMSAGSLLFGK